MNCSHSHSCWRVVLIFGWEFSSSFIIFPRLSSFLLARRRLSSCRVFAATQMHCCFFPTLLFSIVFYVLSCDLGGFLRPADASPQSVLLNKGCSQYNVANTATFFQNLNSSFNDLRAQLNSKKFATTEKAQGSDPVYVLAQCRDYLSTSDCLSCFTTAELQIRNCSSANGARVIYDGCFIRYESNNFFDQTTLPGNVALCGNQTATQKGTFIQLADRVLSDLASATPKIHGYFAAVKSEGSQNTVVYAVAQCILTASESECTNCLNVAYTNIKSCPPEADGRAVDAGCFMRYSSSPFFLDNQTVDITSFLGKNGSSKKYILGGVLGGGALVVILALSFFIFWRQSRKAPSAKGDILVATELQGPMNFHYSDLRTATSNFSLENKLGEGGFGEVYKGILKNGKVVAVKKLAIEKSQKAKDSFEGEVKLISNVHHRNLVRLLGCCSKGPDMMLVYEYMPNKSLDIFLFGDQQGTLNWKQRFGIIVGMARGLAYLHDEFHVCIIHRDIKSSNILLDNDFQPKIADFGLARLLPEGQSHLSTRFAGTLGYTAPEYAIHGQLSEKVDTYSFGVVVLEIVSGRRSNDIKLEPVTQYLLEWSAVSMRPTMSEVVVMLLNKGELGLSKPTRPTFIDATNRVRGDTSTSSASCKSNATMSMSLGAR
ncbi:cysteine-rich receptor-like protein kinase 2 isoform X2 [Nymphaea colorata]|uniref:cysteine-rich receptor-like protein kinase 2 isoform X2 n=1 Tax=Nymphaea colorata TaxID=210225 RepID=UPI00129E9EEF|nr:cysteine-rich receptor-like protein kinase 2 isoform X2 [Nymphaea colorata]